MAEATSTGSAKDPVGAIADAVGKVVTSVSNIILADKQKDIEYQRWLAETFPEYKWFFRYEPNRDKSWIWIVVLSVLIIMIVIATVLLKKRKK